MPGSTWAKDVLRFPKNGFKDHALDAAVRACFAGRHEHIASLPGDDCLTDPQRPLPQ